mgnify:CR=1 FL=1
MAVLDPNPKSTTDRYQRIDLMPANPFGWHSVHRLPTEWSEQGCLGRKWSVFEIWERRGLEMRIPTSRAILTAADVGSYLVAVTRIERVTRGL